MLLVLLAVWGCNGDPAAPDTGAPDAGADAGLEPDAGGEDAGSTDAEPGFATSLPDLESLRALEGERGSVKYLAPAPGAPIREPLREACYFQDTERWPFHLQFLQSFPELADLTFEEYVDLVLRPATRVWWGGALQLYPQALHPISGQAGVIIFTVYDDTGGLTPDHVVEVDGILDACMPFARDALAFFPEDPAQNAMARNARTELEGRDVAVVFAEDLGL